MKSTKKKKIDIKLGSVSATQDELDLKNAKIRVTMMIDLDVVKGFRTLAEKTGSKYQTLMNQKLKDALKSENDKQNISERLEKLEKHVYSLKPAM